MNEGNLRHFQPGNRANPGGRPKGLGRYVREKLGEDGELLVNYALRTFADPKRRHRDRWEALCWLADRGWGKPAQALTGPEGEPLELGTPDLVRLQVVLLAALRDFPEARVQAAQALMALDAQDGPGEVPGGNAG